MVHVSLGGISIYYKQLQYNVLYFQAVHLDHYKK